MRGIRILINYVIAVETYFVYETFSCPVFLQINKMG